MLRRERDILVAAEPFEFVVSNVILSVLKTVREESAGTRLGSDDLSQYDLLNAADQICSGDVVITHSLSKSSTLRAFFEAAKAAHRSFRLFTVDEDSDLAGSLDSVDILSAMRLATRVVIPAIALLPDGSCIAPAGTIPLCLAAKRHVVPVIVCAAFYKITPFFIPHFDKTQPLYNPATVVPFSEAESFSNVHIVNPLFDLIPAQLVSLYICHTSVLSPPHVYRLIGDYYHPNDTSNICA
ncbi:unnamed protein product [Enterobius vermicularis]|uniref:Translation initiation factor eIF2B subunit beta n=1 Tax=Enterobius vermicularis TaxID=51028 RepID=A0A0N4V2Z1_ENTVE|nr:unnamed protein product [Enterobius vermicularis]